MTIPHHPSSTSPTAAACRDIDVRTFRFAPPGLVRGGGRRFSILLAVFGSEVGRMLGWVFAGGGPYLKYNFNVI